MTSEAGSRKHDNIKIYKLFPGEPGAEVSEEKKNIIAKREFPKECAQGDRPARCPSHFFAVNEPSAVPWW